MTIRLTSRHLVAGRSEAMGAAPLRGSTDGMALAEVPGRLARTAATQPLPSQATRRRSMAGYLAMPRPGDLFKACLLPLTFAVGTLAVGHVDAQMLQRLALMVFAVEFLIYPARYQWNDIRGFAADQCHPAADERGRLPGPLELGRQHIAASAAAAIGRLALAAALVFAFPTLHLGGLMLAAVLGVFGVAVVYEALRARCTGRVDELPPPVRRPVVLLWMTVGTGYVVRGLLGLGLVVDLSSRPGLAVAAGLTLWAFGVGFVTSRWAVEVTAFANIRRGDVTWQVESRHAREHLIALVRWLPTRAVPEGPAGAQITSAADWTPLRGRTALTAPWNPAYIAAGAAGVVTGVLLVHPGPVSFASTIFCAALGAGGSLVVIMCASARRTAAVLVGLLLVALSVTMIPASPVAVVPWAAVMLSYCASMRQSLRTMGTGTAPIKRALLKCSRAASRLVVGPSAWEVLTGGPGISTPEI